MTIFDGALPPALLPLAPPLSAPALLHQAESWARRLPDDAVEEPRPGDRSSRVLSTTESYDVWVVRWAPGSRSGLHEHGRSAGAIAVVEGQLLATDASERGTAGGAPARVASARGLYFAPHRVHEVENASARGATSVHVYSPPLDG